MAVDPVITELYLHGTEPNEIVATDMLGSGGDYHTAWGFTDALGSLSTVASKDLGDWDVVHSITSEYGGNRQQLGDTSVQHLMSSSIWAGHHVDEDTGLTEAKARWYDSSTGRFISQDPTGFAAGDENLYRYVGNGPNSATDPTGLERIAILPDGTEFIAEASGHHRAPWQVFSNPKYKFSRNVMEVFDGGSKDALITGKWYNFHGNTTIGNVTHPQYNDLVRVELDRFIRTNRIRNGDFKPPHASKFLEHLRGLPADHKITVFNAGIAAERDLARIVGDNMYEQKKSIFRSSKAVSKEVLDKVGNEVRSLLKDETKYARFMNSLTEVAEGGVSKLGKASEFAKGAASKGLKALLLYSIANKILSDGRVTAGEIRDEAISNSPLIGDAIQSGMVLGSVFEYLQREVDNPRTMQDWARSRRIYDPSESSGKINTHGIELD